MWCSSYTTYFRPLILGESAHIEVCLVVGYFEGSVSTFSYSFSCFILVCMLCRLSLYIITFWAWSMFHWGFLVLAFKRTVSLATIYFLQQFTLVRKCNNSGLWIIYFRSVNYTCYIGYVQGFEQYLYLKDFSKQWKCSTCKYCEISL